LSLVPIIPLDDRADLTMDDNKLTKIARRARAKPIAIVAASQVHVAYGHFESGAVCDNGAAAGGQSTAAIPRSVHQVVG
jgi:hypothetical protein